MSTRSAAFGRLCVETKSLATKRRLYGVQPPSGGCVLKQHLRIKGMAVSRQPPSGGCVLKLATCKHKRITLCQPPSGGCVLKLPIKKSPIARAFQPPSGGCVLKHHPQSLRRPAWTSAAFGRLCVETSGRSWRLMRRSFSRLRAAVC